MDYPPVLLFAIGAIGPWEILLILLIVLLIFGASRIPEIMRSMGRGVKEFKKGIKEVNRELGEDTEEEEDRKPSRLAEGQKRNEGDTPPHGEGA